LVLRLLDGLNRDFGRRDEHHGLVTGRIGPDFAEIAPETAHRFRNKNSNYYVIEIVISF
jgi:hypothetical protein